MPALPQSLWIPSLDAAWFASAAVTAAYRNSVASAEEIAAARCRTGCRDGRRTADDAMPRAGSGGTDDCAAGPEGSAAQVDTVSRPPYVGRCPLYVGRRP